jgi:hypothetical protein
VEDEEEDNAPTILIIDVDIQQRIKNYKEIDLKRGLTPYELTIADVRRLLENPICYKCHKKTSWWSWTLDRIDNHKGHSPNNVRLACEKCNRFKSDNEHQLFFWDTETPYQTCYV